MSFSKGVAAMSMHSLLGPSNSESFPEFDLVSTVKMAWLPPHVKYWISKLVKTNDGKVVREMMQ